MLQQVLGTQGIEEGGAFPSQQLSNTLVRGRAWRPGNSPAAPPPARQCPARPRGRWRRRRSTPRPSECCGAHPRPAGSTGRSAATRSTMCAWRAPRPAGHRASRTSCWRMPRWAGAAGVAGAGVWARFPLCSPLPLLAPLSLPSSLSLHRLPLSGRWTTQQNM